MQAQRCTNRGNKMIRLVVCDDHEMVRTGLVRVLEVNRLFHVVAQASSSAQLLGLMVKFGGREFDVLLLDLNLGAARLVDSIDLIEQLVRLQPAMRIVVVSMHNEPDIVNAALKRGALGYVSKVSSIDVLQEAIAHAHQGRRFLDPNLVEAVVVNRQHPAEFAWSVDLSKREREVMLLLCGGQRVSDIAMSLSISVKTVSTHKIRLMEKLDIKNNADLIKFGMKHRLT
jgi:DNA-binding NarL/FixJ family response regulator